MQGKDTAPAVERTVCPGCHFGCLLAKYQCGRGKEFYDLAAEGGEVPVRRGPMMTPSERAANPDGKPPLNDRVMHGFNILSNRLQDRHVEAGERKVVLSLVRAGGFMSLPILAKRMLLTPDELDNALEDAQQEGLAAVEEDDRIGRIARLTDAGKAQAAMWKAERDEQTAEFLSALSEEEKETLVAHVRKLLGMK